MLRSHASNHEHRRLQVCPAGESQAPPPAAPGFLQSAQAARYDPDHVEGINLFVAGGREGIEELLSELRSIPGLEELTAKYSESDSQPFNRMLVRIKKEIIAFGVEGIDPATRTSEKLPPQTLKQWLDDGRPVTLLDTRNDYEVKLGTFHGAKTFDLDHFRNFPAAVATLPEEMKDEPIVMFCTGGIRCEKAGPYMESRGFRKYSS